MSNTYLVTGATGFVGANLVRRLISDEENVHILTRDKKLNFRISDISSKITVHEVDLLSPKLFKIIDKIKPKYIFHLAVYGSLPNEKNVEELINTNLLGLMNLINALKQNKFKLMINTGSSSEYGIKENPMKESDLLVPINDYGLIKASATMLVSKEAIRNNLPIITFRLFSPYGPYEHVTRLIPSVILSALKNNPIKVSDKKSVRDFTYIDDIIDAYTIACNLQFNPGEIFNIATGRQHRVAEVVEKIVALTKSKSKIEWRVKAKQERQVEPKRWVADIKKSNKIMGWEPKYSLEQGLGKTVDWFLENNNLYE